MAGANKDKEITTLLKNNAGFNDDDVNTWFWIKEYESMLKEFYGIDNFPYEMYSFYLSKDLKPSSEIEMSKINEYIQNFSNLQSRQQFLQKYAEIKHFLQTIPFELEQCLDYLRDYDKIEDPMYNNYKKKISNIAETGNRRFSMKSAYDYMNKSATLVALYKFWQSFPNKSEIIDGIELFEENPENHTIANWAEFYNTIIEADKIYNREQKRSSSSTPSPINQIKISPEGKRAQPDYSRTGSGLAKALRHHEVKKLKQLQQDRLRDLRNSEIVAQRNLRQRTDSSGWSEYGSDDRSSPPLISGTAADATFVPRPSPISSPLREASPPASDTCGPSGCMIMGGKRKTKRRKRRPIKINKKMKGVFTRKAKKHRMSVQKYARYVIKKFKGKTKNKKQLKLLRQAVFAKTAKKWKKRKKKHTRHKKKR